ncbi:hypothetical protein VP01_353g3 [Puccinia sorghi]|uniref:Uncharacterized protein n=1 Tax=Puccinia sorghi TaxID=27349 RepID=A0A0L6UVG1_9BASI|nr:hypothetical protein VP01_353g3 [Puccinia sorghi]
MANLKILKKFLRLSRGLPKIMDMKSASEDLKRTRIKFSNLTGMIFLFIFLYPFPGGSADQNQRKHNPPDNPKFTCLIGCPFSLSNYSHIHPPSTNPASNVINRKLDYKAQQEVLQLSNSVLKPSKI